VICSRTIEGALEFALRVAPGKGKTQVVGRYGDRLKVQVSEAPEKGKANQAVKRLLARTFGVRFADVEIVRGLASPDKTVRVRGIGAEALAAFDHEA
jgi:uncharacterized protein (TIGR00251 family)